MTKIALIILSSLALVFLMTGNAMAIFFNTIESVHPLPEPVAMLLLGAGLLAMAGLGRRKIIHKNTAAANPSDQHGMTRNRPSAVRT